MNALRKVSRFALVAFDCGFLLAQTVDHKGGEMNGVVVAVAQRDPRTAEKSALEMIESQSLSRLCQGFSSPTPRRW